MDGDFLCKEANDGRTAIPAISFALMKTAFNIDETVIQRIEKQARGGHAPVAAQPPVSFQPEGYPKCVLP